MEEGKLSPNQIGLNLIKSSFKICRLRLMIVNRVFTVLKFYFELISWMGVFHTFDYIGGKSLKQKLIVLGITLPFLCLVGGLKSGICSPCGNGIDRPNNYIAVKTLFMKQTPQEKFHTRVLDAICSVAFLQIGVSAFWGLWTAIDYACNHDKSSRDNIGLDAVYCEVR